MSDDSLHSLETSESIEKNEVKETETSRSSMVRPYMGQNSLDDENDENNDTVDEIGHFQRNVRSKSSHKPRSRKNSLKNLFERRPSLLTNTSIDSQEPEYGKLTKQYSHQDFFSDDLLGGSQITRVMTDSGPGSRKRSHGDIESNILKENGSSSTEGDDEKSLGSCKSIQRQQSWVPAELERITTSIRTTISARARKVGFFSDEFRKTRSYMVVHFALVYLVMVLFVMGIFSVYWGSLYNRDSRLKNLKFLIIGDEVGDESLLTDTVLEASETPEMQAKGTWIYMDSAEIPSQYTNATEFAIHEVHRQNYWAAILVTRNSTDNIRQAFETANNSFTNEGLIYMIYESGRDLTGFAAYVMPSLNALEVEVLSLQGDGVYGPIINTLSPDQTLEVAANTTLASRSLSFTRIDYRPVTAPVTQAPQQIGLIYLSILSFFQFNFLSPIHAKVSQDLRRWHFVLYRMIASQISFLVLSLAFTLVSVAFQVNFSTGWSHGGIAVAWMFSYLTMAAAGGYNENMALYAFATYPPLVGFGMLGFVIVNVAPTFAPLELSPGFYQYGKAMPLYNGFQLLRTVLFGTTKKHIGLNIGVLFAWIIAMNALLPFSLSFFARKKTQEATAAREAAQAAAAKSKPGA
ncbi:BA75_04068T0 [Komagataella pastoris]|uniref:BA75_04068T0 n=1 Tax=Komagataella pastoris TaxID=4922 RepID=A0A1B2JG45_PICPA|nr:BA75_04068T0 [Komagataella pastoris]